jgi:hypothetical protein
MHQQVARFSFRRLVAALAVGLIVGVGAYALTGYWTQQVFLGFCQPTIQAGFDPWTGLPHGSTIHCPPGSGTSIGATDDTKPQTTFVDPIPTEIAGRRAIPVPIGFILGGGAALLLPLVRRRAQPVQPTA